MFRYLIIILLSIIKLRQCEEDYRINYVNMNKGARSVSIISKKIDNDVTFKRVPELVEDNFVVSATYIQQINSTGWAHLLVNSSNKHHDDVQAYMSGNIEGDITKDLIAAHWSNNYEGFCSSPSTYCTKLYNYLKLNFLSLVNKTRNSRGFLKMVRLQLWQIKGLQDGYDGVLKTNASEINESYLLTMQDQLFKLYLLQADGDLGDLSSILGGSDYHRKFFSKNPISDEKCSAFVKYVKGSILTSHVTWNHYNSMLRMTKLYIFPYRVNSNELTSPLVPAIKISFSSYPAQTASVDDFYVTSAGLVTTETTIGNNNESLWKPLETMASEIILEYFRVQAANRLATSGPEWIGYFSTDNSGTYNNQWMIVNNNVMKDHKYGERIPDGALYVAEQIPSLIASADLTEHLRTAYWPSYNTPYFKSIWDLGAFQLSVDKYGDFADYNKAPRALMFKRNASNVVDYNSLMRLMRYNDFKHDPLAKCACNPPYSGENGISARCDLNPKNGTYPFSLLGYRLHGGTDMKFTTTELSLSMQFVAISGPTYDDQPVFDWSLINDPGAKHLMQPQKFKFGPVLSPFT